MLEFAGSTSLPSGVPSSRTSGDGSKEIAYQSTGLEAGRVVYSSYGINGGTGPDVGIPIRRFDNTSATNPMPRFTEVRAPSELVFMFDGHAFLLAHLARYHALPLLRAGGRVRFA